MHTQVESRRIPSLSCFENEKSIPYRECLRLVPKEVEDVIVNHFECGRFAFVVESEDRLDKVIDLPGPGQRTDRPIDLPRRLTA